MIHPGSLLVTNLQGTAGDDTSTYDEGVGISSSIHLEFNLQENKAHGSNGSRWTDIQKYKTETPLRAYTNLERMTNILVSMNAEGDFHCKGVPLVGARFFSNNILRPKIMSMFSRYHEALEKVFDLLVNNTRMDMKLFNTFGPAIDYSSDRTNITMRLDIQVDGSKTEDLKESITQRILRFIEDSNTVPGRGFKVSHLVSVLHNDFSQIREVNIRSINGVAPGRIEPIYSDEDRENLADYVPEFLNVSMIIGSQGTLIPDIVIDFID